ncbi:Mitotic checkpoint serine/threonine-protein kinase BUB1 [Portunus trituberculatus]|uniref:Mitotic checkpoint serine/threonine-protein kinase BUB1 n=1 Tax=Portunus trituberculatus TaxID=210409 RepID=A0A5B7IPT1_PORTR|nr:Mitotic checkpoint serine/threonine-protein kinase BUB1 [Portunus trituberculatus]
MCGEGAYAKVFRAITVDALNVTVMPYDEEEDDEQQVILKVQKPAFPWEFYICHELRQRLKASKCSQRILNSVMKCDRGYFFSNGSALVNKYHAFGTLLDVVNR